MVDTRQKGLRYLDGFLGQPRPFCIAVSKFFRPEESWTGKETWWFDLPIENIEQRPEKHYFLVGEWARGQFVVLKVPNRFLLDNMDSFDTKHDRCIRLHLAAYDENWLVDERATDGVCFSDFEMKEPPAHKQG
jgi:hypothetical protein